MEQHCNRTAAKRTIDDDITVKPAALSRQDVDVLDEPRCDVDELRVRTQHATANDLQILQTPNLALPTVSYLQSSCSALHTTMVCSTMHFWATRLRRMLLQVIAYAAS
jgi:hypothetical protein